MPGTLDRPTAAKTPPGPGAAGAALEERLDSLERAVASQLARASALAEIGLALSSTLDLDGLLRQVMDRVTSLLEADRSTLYLVDRERGEIWSKVLKGARPREIRLPIGLGIAGWVARHGRAVSLDDAYRDGRFHPDVDQLSGYRTRSVLCLPLRGRSGEVVGVIQALNRRGGAFSDEDERLLASVASQASVALENARLFAELERRNQDLRQVRDGLHQKVAELDLLHGLERRFAAATDLPAALDAVLERVIEVCGAQAGALLLREADQGQLFFRSARGGKPEVVRPLRIPLGTGISGAVAASGRPILANDVGREKAFDPALAARIGYTVESALCVPLSHQGEVLGALELLNKRGGFDGGDLDLLRLVATESARMVAVGRAREAQSREERLVAIGQMLSGVMHDLRTPMTVISGYAQLMVDEPDAAERRRACELILKQFDAVSAMTREVLEFARGKVEVLRRKVLVNVFMEEVAEYLRRDLAGKGVELRVRTRYAGAARFDEVKMKRVIYNIARNAAQAMARGGRFTLHVGKEKDRLVFRMSDTGPGIPEEMRGRLFESFASHGKADGTGLGLAIVKRIAEEHGGSVECRTRSGKGTTFIVSLPT